MPQTVSSTNTRRIAKNTLLLYIRQFFTLGLSLYTSRLTLQVLGANDFGVYAAVGGFTALLTILTSSMAGSGQRFLTFELAKGDKSRLNMIFNTFMQLMLLLSTLLILLAETVGVWFIENYLTIPPERLEVALWVFQLSIFTCVVNILNAPYNSVIVAHEDMGKFALFSIVDAILKLLFVALLFINPWDKLLMYAISLATIQVINRFAIGFYCRYKYAETHITLSVNLRHMKQMAGFAGWTLLANLSVMGFTQGVNVLLNICFGPVVNAAYTTANQAYSGIRSFCSSFQLASNPQIVKSYSEGRLDELNKLLLFVCKMSFFLIFIISLPFLVNADSIMHLWLIEVPDYTTGFFCVLLIYAYMDVFAYPLDTAAQATGKLRAYTLRTSLLLLCDLPLGYMLFRMGARPESIYISAILIGLCGLMIRLVTLKSYIQISLKSFLLAFARCMLAAAFSFAFAYALHSICRNGLVQTAVSFFFCFTESTAMVYIIGLRKDERDKIKSIVCKKISQRNICVK